MSDSKVLDKAAKEVVKQAVNVSSGEHNDQQLDAREHRTEELIHDMESRMKKATRDFKASEEMQIEARELSHEMAGRIKRISKTAKTEDAFERDVDEAVVAALRYTIGKIRTENKEEKEKKEKEKEKEKEKPSTRHAVEKPDVFTKKTDITTKKTETVNEAAAIPAIKVKKTADNPLLANSLNTPVKKTPAVPSADKPIAPVQKNADKASVHNEIAHAIQNPREGKYRYTKKTPDSPKLRSVVADSLLDPEDALQKRRDAFKKRLENRYVNRNSFTDIAKSAYKEKKTRTKATESINAVPSSDGNKAPSRPIINLKAIPQLEDQEFEVIRSGYEGMDRGSAVTGNLRSELYLPGQKSNGAFSEIESTSPPPQRSTNNQETSHKQAVDDAEAAGYNKKKNKKKKRGIADSYERKLAQQAGKQLLMAILRPPVVIYLGIALLVLYIIILVIAILVGLGDDPNGQGAIPVTISKTGPAKGSIGQNLIYNIAVGYAGSASDVTIVDKLPANVKYISSAPAGVYDATAQTVTWKASTLKIAITNPVSMSVAVTLQATANNVFITNVATATVDGTAAGGGGGPASGNWVAPNTNNCGGKYKFTSPLSKNFGDPDCNMTKDQLYTQLKTEDPANADVWFNKIIPCESGYNPNAYAGPQTGTPDAAGAWGLFQMGSSAPPGSAPPAPGKNGPNDRGDVPWVIQASNAIATGKKIGSLAKYWACAR